MAITDKKITPLEVQTNQVESAQDDYIGTSAQEVKAIFDKLPKRHIEKYNQLIDMLTSNGGASEIGAAVGTVQSELDRINNEKADKSQLDYKASIGYVDTALEEAKDYADSVVVEIGAGDMAKAIYDADGDGRIDNAAFADRSHFSEVCETAYNGIFMLKHTKSGTIHSLNVEGVFPDVNHYTIRFNAVSDYAEGDSFTINDSVYTAKPTGEETVLPDKLFVAGDIVTAEVDVSNKKLVFKGGGGGGMPKEWQDIRTATAGEDIQKGDAVLLVNEITLADNLKVDSDYTGTGFLYGLVDVQPPNLAFRQLSKDKTLLALVSSYPKALYLYKLNREAGIYEKLPDVDIPISEPAACIVANAADAVFVLWAGRTAENRNLPTITIYHINQTSVTKGGEKTLGANYFAYTPVNPSVHMMSDNEIFYLSYRYNTSEFIKSLMAINCIDYKNDVITIQSVSSGGSTKITILGEWVASDGKYDFVHACHNAEKSAAYKYEQIIKINTQNMSEKTVIYNYQPGSSYETNSYGGGAIDANSFWGLYKEGDRYYFKLFYFNNDAKTSVGIRSLWTTSSNVFSGMISDNGILYMVNSSVTPYGYCAYAFDQSTKTLNKIAGPSEMKYGSQYVVAAQQKSDIFLYSNNQRAIISRPKRIYKVANKKHFRDALTLDNFGFGMAVQNTAKDGLCKINLLKKLNQSIGGTI